MFSNRDELLAYIRDEGVKFVDVRFTDLPGIQFYAGNYIIDEKGKDGVLYGRRSGVALETQFFPDSVNHPEWPQPFVKAGEHYHSVTEYKFSW